MRIEKSRIQAFPAMLGEYLEISRCGRTPPRRPDAFMGKIKVLLKRHCDIDLILPGECSGYMRATYDGSSESSLAEIEYIQTNYVTDKRPIWAYLHGDIRNHVELVIVEKDRLTKPIVWPLVEGIQAPSLCAPTFLRSKIKAVFCPQARTKWGCGYLSIAAAMELLSDKAKQYRELCLHVPILDDTSELATFFVPSPSLLFYSQSESYCDYVESILMSDMKNVTMQTWNGARHTFPTIRGQLDRVIACEKLSEATKDCSRSLLAGLAEFRVRWMEVYKQVKADRHHFVGRGLNHALSCYGNYLIDAIAGHDEALAASRRCYEIPRPSLDTASRKPTQDGTFKGSHFFSRPEITKRRQERINAADLASRSGVPGVRLLW